MPSADYVDRLISRVLQQHGIINEIDDHIIADDGGNVKIAVAEQDLIGRIITVDRIIARGNIDRHIRSRQADPVIVVGTADQCVVDGIDDIDLPSADYVDGRISQEPQCQFVISELEDLIFVNDLSGIIKVLGKTDRIVRIDTQDGIIAVACRILDHHIGTVNENYVIVTGPAVDRNVVCLSTVEGIIFVGAADHGV